MEDYQTLNKQAWDAKTLIHVESEFYDVAGFLSGRNSLNPIELELLGDVRGKSLLHLQCHFGQDSLSLSRMGAKVTGVDISPEAIRQAEVLKERLKLDASFLVGDVQTFNSDGALQYDLVFSSYGVLCWLEDLSAWAETVARSIKPGGTFHLVEFHPLIDLFEGYSYFEKKQPDIIQEGTYTENCDGKPQKVVTWSHSLGEVINALISAGLVVTDFREYPYSPVDCFAGLELVEGKGYQRLRDGLQVPLVYSVSALKA